MTAQELTAYYTRETRIVHEAYENGFIDHTQYEAWIIKLDNELFQNFGFIAEMTPENAIYDAEIGVLRFR